MRNGIEKRRGFGLEIPELTAAMRDIDAATYKRDYINTDLKIRVRYDDLIKEIRKIIGHYGPVPPVSTRVDTGVIGPNPLKKDPGAVVGLNFWCTDFAASKIASAFPHCKVMDFEGNVVSPAQNIASKKPGPGGP